MKLNGGGLNALARHAVAALLNAYVADYGLTVDQITAAGNAAIHSGDVNEIESLKDDLDYLNNQGCPYDQHGELKDGYVD